MSLINFKTGNILDVEKGIICHSVNHRGVAGGGLAKQIKDAYPEFMDDYLYNCKNYSFEDIRNSGRVSFYQVTPLKWIASIFGQDDFRGSGRRTDYYSLYAGFCTVSAVALADNTPVAIPYKIGCGLGGGDWDTVLAMIVKLFSDCSLDVMIYELPQ